MEYAMKYGLAVVGLILSLNLLSCGGSDGGGTPPTAGALDSSFGTGGKVTTLIGAGEDSAFALVLQADGKIVAAGQSFNGSNFDFALVRYNPDGNLDTNFGNGGKVTTDFGSGNDGALALVLQTDGKIVAAGYSFNGSKFDFALARYNPDGSLDPSFDTDGNVTTAIGSGNNIAYAVVLQSDGKIVVVGSSSNGTNNDFALVRYNPNGSLDTSFDTDGKVTTDFGSGNDGARSVVVQAEGEIVVVGFSINGTDSDFALVRYNPNGSLDTSFDTDGKVSTDFGSDHDYAYAVVLQADDKLVAAGYSTANSNNGLSGDFALVRYNPDGILDTSFDTDGKVMTDIGSTHDAAFAVVLQVDGKLVAAGGSNNGTNFDFALARYNHDGSVDTTFGTVGKVTTAIGSGNDGASGLILQADGKVLAAGYSNNGDNRDFALARYWP